MNHDISRGYFQENVTLMSLLLVDQSLNDGKLNLSRIYWIEQVQ